jgi:hypothetical protein
LGEVQINDNLKVPLSALRAALSGKPVVVPRTARFAAKGKLKFTVVGIHTSRLPAEVRDVSTQLIARVLNDFREADERICKAIGVDREIGAAAMAKLWKWTFVVERDRRAGPDANAQRRGRITRQLKAELQEVISDGDY